MSSSVAAALRPTPVPKSNVLRSDPAAQAFMLLRIAFTVAPILFGLDKFAEVMIGDWPKYLAPEFNDLIPGSAADAMLIVGAVEIAAGIVVAVTPRFGGLLVAGWLGGIIVSLLLVGGYVAVRRRKYELHLKLMFAALGSSALFFVSYVVYHHFHGDTKFLGTGSIRAVYFFVLISHIILSAVAVPLILLSFYLSLAGRLALHRKVSRYTFPIWLYVSVTGVMIYLMLRYFG